MSTVPQQLQRRHDATDRSTPLPSGHRDPLGARTDASDADYATAQDHVPPEDLPPEPPNHAFSKYAAREIDQLLDYVVDRFAKAAPVKGEPELITARREDLNR